MQTTRHFRFFAFLALVGLLAGCEGGSGVSSGPDIVVAKTSEMPALSEGEYSLDEDRLLVYAPEGWRGSRTDKALTRLRPNNASYPSIFITADSSTNPLNLTEKNATSFLEKIRGELKAEGVKPAGPTKIAKAGNRYAIIYLRSGTDRDMNRIEKFYAITVIDGRRYTLEMLCANTDHAPHIPAVWAVLKGMKTGSSAAPAENTPAEDAPAIEAPETDTPAEDAPAEDTPAEE